MHMDSNLDVCPISDQLQSIGQFVDRTSVIHNHILQALNHPKIHGFVILSHYIGTYSLGKESLLPYPRCLPLEARTDNS